MSTNNYNTFWKILLENKVQIPTIQRDYTYGRKSASGIRTKLISDIVDSIRNRKNINLDFVYGKLLGKENQASLERNRSNIQSLLTTIKSYAMDLHVEVSDLVVLQNVSEQRNVSFIPLDGQQRLTTLFLVHWYIAQRNNDKNALKILENFSYATRISSKDFCLMLCTYTFNLERSDVSGSEVVCNHEKYFSFWEKDPTVKSMLIVIDDIHKTFNTGETEYSGFWNSLTVSDVLTFNFFDLEDFELTDDLYIKMNARGKQLTKFENFKAWLIKEYQEWIYVDNWKIKFDIKWYDFFWKAKEKTGFSVDTEFLRFFKILYLGDYIKSLKSDESGMNDENISENYEADNLNLEDFKSVVTVLRNTDSDPIEIFKSNKIFKDNINDYLCILDKLILGDESKLNLILKKYINTDVTTFLFGEKLNHLTWWDTAFLYAFTRFLIKTDKHGISIIEWTRIISNLIYNTRIDTPKLFRDAVDSIDSLLTKMDTETSVNGIISLLKSDEIAFFSSVQKEEEIFKAKLILMNPEWENLLIDCENHIYFYGQIGFIFKMLEQPIDIESFKKTYNKVSSLFSEIVLNDTTFLLTRTFLSEGECFYEEGKNKVFNYNVRGTMRNRSENWRKFFDSKLEFIKKVISHNLFKEDNIISSLNEIIQSNLPLLNGVYFSKFIENPELFKYPQKQCITKSGVNYYLLNKTRLSGYFVELYTYDFFLRKQNDLKQRFNGLYEITYFEVKGQESEPYILFKSSNHEIHLERNYESGKFFIFKDELKIDEFDTIENAVTSI